MEGKEEEKRAAELKKTGLILLEIGSVLMSSGANTTRIRTNINRISGAFGYNTELLVTHRAIMLSVSDNDQNNFFSSLKRTSPHGVNFKVISGISRMSWRIVEEKWNVDQIRAELDRLAALPHYPRILILFLVALAGASLCRIFGGFILEMSVAFIATFAGLFVRQEAVKRNFNPYLCVYFGSLTASLLSGLAVKLHLGTVPETAFATSVLFLVPGVPLINTFIDLLDGNLMNGILRGINGLIIAFSIALGLLTSMIIYQIW
jgi:uncharacterized membrane protein YjjP (DUF1212 family)